MKEDASPSATALHWIPAYAGMTEKSREVRRKDSKPVVPYGSRNKVGMTGTRMITERSGGEMV
jgi:hypothetical protein